MSDVHRQASGWLLAHSPYDLLVHAAKATVYMTSGEPALSLACEGDFQYSTAKLPRRRYETHDAVVSCLSCLVVADDDAP